MSRALTSRKRSSTAARSARNLARLRKPLSSSSGSRPSRLSSSPRQRFSLSWVRRRSSSRVSVASARRASSRAAADSRSSMRWVSRKRTPDSAEGFTAGASPLVTARSDAGCLACRHDTGGSGARPPVTGSGAGAPERWRAGHRAVARPGSGGGRIYKPHGQNRRRREPMETPARRGAARILIAEDDASLRRLLEMRLDVDGYTTRAVADGAAALEVLSEWLPDVVVTDVMMPRLSGLSLCREMRAAPRTAAAPRGFPGEWLPDVVVTDVMMPRLSGLSLCREMRAAPRTAAIPV